MTLQENKPLKILAIVHLIIFLFNLYLIFYSFTGLMQKLPTINAASLGVSAIALSLWFFISAIFFAFSRIYASFVLLINFLLFAILLTVNLYGLFGGGSESSKMLFYIDIIFYLLMSVSHGVIYFLPSLRALRKSSNTGLGKKLLLALGFIFILAFPFILLFLYNEVNYRLVPVKAASIADESLDVQESMKVMNDGNPSTCWETGRPDGLGTSIVFFFNEEIVIAGANVFPGKLEVTGEKTTISPEYPRIKTVELYIQNKKKNTLHFKDIPDLLSVQFTPFSATAVKVVITEVFPGTKKKTLCIPDFIFLQKKRALEN